LTAQGAAKVVTELVLVSAEVVLVVTHLGIGAAIVVVLRSALAVQAEASHTLLVLELAELTGITESLHLLLIRIKLIHLSIVLIHTIPILVLIRWCIVHHTVTRPTDILLSPRLLETT